MKPSRIDHRSCSITALPFLFCAPITLIWGPNVQFFMDIFTFLIHLQQQLTFIECLLQKGDPKKRNVFLKNCVFILTCLNPSHLQMQYIYQDVFLTAQNSFELVNVDVF